MTDGGARRQIRSLTGIRFFLAFWVVAYHHNIPLSRIMQSYRVLDWFVPTLQTGYAAVGAFFVLSGFVLAYNYDLAALHLPHNLKRFAIARFSRIYPTYLAGLLCFVPLALHQTSTQWSSQYYGIVNFLLNLALLQAWVPSAALTWNFPGWSLSNEAFFYAALPLAGGWFCRLAKSASVKKGNSIPALLAAAAVLWLLSLAVPLCAVLLPVHHLGDVSATTTNVMGADPWANLIRYNPLLRIPEFLMGVILALFYRLIPRNAWLWNRGFYFYFPGIAAALVLLSNADRIPYPLIHNGLLLPAWALIVFGLALDGGLLSRLLALPPLVFLGNASYAMYILHSPISAWMNIVFLRILKLELDGNLWLSCYLVACIGVSCLFFKFIEEPLHRWLKARRGAKVQLGAASR